jgi:hypothetical protein
VKEKTTGGTPSELPENLFADAKAGDRQGKLLIQLLSRTVHIVYQVAIPPRIRD